MGIRGTWESGVLGGGPVGKDEQGVPKEKELMEKTEVLARPGGVQGLPTPPPGPQTGGTPVLGGRCPPAAHPGAVPYPAQFAEQFGDAGEPPRRPLVVAVLEHQLHHLGVPRAHRLLQHWGTGHPQPGTASTRAR